MVNRRRIKLKARTDTCTWRSQSITQSHLTFSRMALCQAAVLVWSMMVVIV